MLNRVREDVAREWLVAAYGDAKAAEAMRVPWELRVQLYPEVLRWGPNGLQIATLFDAARDPVFASPEVHDAADLLMDVMFKSGRYKFRNGWDDAAQYLYDQFTVVNSSKLNAVRVRAVPVATVVTALLMSAPWFPVIAEEFTRFGCLVDEFLAAAGFPILGADNGSVAHV